MSKKRNLRSLNLKDLSLEDRTKEALAREHYFRMNKAQMRMEEHWKEFVKKEVPRWALWTSANVPPKWYLSSAKYVLMTLPRELALGLRAANSPEWVVVLTHLTTSLITFPLTFLLISPFLWMRKILGHWGLWVRIVKIDKWVLQMKVIKWWKVIDDTRWEV